MFRADEVDCGVWCSNGSNTLQSQFLYLQRGLVPVLWQLHLKLNFLFKINVCFLIPAVVMVIFFAKRLCLGVFDQAPTLLSSSSRCLLVENLFFSGFKFPCGPEVHHRNVLAALGHLCYCFAEEEVNDWLVWKEEPGMLGSVPFFLSSLWQHFCFCFSASGPAGVGCTPEAQVTPVQAWVSLILG